MQQVRAMLRNSLSTRDCDRSARPGSPATSEAREVTDEPRAQRQGRGSGTTDRAAPRRRRHRRVVGGGVREEGSLAVKRASQARKPKRGTHGAARRGEEPSPSPTTLVPGAAGRSPSAACRTDG